jgi:hypothetical protein
MSSDGTSNLTPIGTPQLVLTGSNKKNSFDYYSVAFPSLLEEEGEFFLYYTGAANKNWGFTSIGVATSRNLFEFRRKNGSIIEGQKNSKFSYEAVTPAIIKVKSKYYLIFAGRKHRYDHRVLGIAYSDDPAGPFKIIGVIYKPSVDWEGYSIDNGSTLVKITEDEFLIYYSNCAPSLKNIILRKPFIRKIGFLKVKIKGVTSNSIEVFSSKNPVSLNGPIGSWTESVFCPGYLHGLSNENYLFFATSTYSKYPISQYIGYISVDSPFLTYFKSQPFKILSAKDIQEISNIKYVGFDYPCPINDPHKKGKIILLYSVLDRTTNQWSIFRSILEVKED